MNSLSGVVCREVFDENSQPSAEEISEYAQQLGIDPDSESHLLPLARDGLMQALPPPWKAYYDEKLQTHYYYNEETKKTQWDHPLDDVYKDLVKKARDASVHDDTCASVQELLTSEENTKHLERVETKVESDDEDLTTDSENQPSETKDNPKLIPGPRRLAPLGRPPLAPLKLPIDKKLAELRISPLRRSAEGPVSPKPVLMRNTSDRDLFSRPALERPKMLFKQQSEILDLKGRGLSPDDDNFSALLSGAKIEKGLPLQGKSGMYFRVYKSELPSPDTDKSLPLDSMTKSDPPKGILREKITESFHKKTESLMFGRQKQPSSLDEDRKSVRFKLESRQEPTISPGSNSSSELNDGQSSIISANPAPSLPSPIIPSSPTNLPLQGPIVLSPLVSRPPLPPKTLDSPTSQKNDSPREVKSVSSEKDSMESDSQSRGLSPKRRLLRPPAGDYIKPDLFQKNFQRISDLVRPGDLEPSVAGVEDPGSKEIRPRSPMIPQKNKISINLMESIESETSIDSPDKEFANLDLNDLDDSNVIQDDILKSPNEGNKKDFDEYSEKTSLSSKTSLVKSPRLIEVPIPLIKVPKLDLSKKCVESEDLKKSPINEKRTIEIKDTVQPKLSPTPSLGSDFRSPRADFNKPWSSLSTFKPLNKAVIAPQMKCDSSNNYEKGLTSPRLDGVILSQGKSTDNVVVVYQFESQEQPRIKSPMMPDNRDIIERNKHDERRRLELALQREIEGIKVEWTAKERRMRAELQDEIRQVEEKFREDKRVRLIEQAERHRKELEDALKSSENKHQESLDKLAADMHDRVEKETARAEKQFNDNMMKLQNEYRNKLLEQREKLQIENERALSELHEQLQVNLNRERSRMIEENRANLESLRDDHTNRITDLRHDYRVEVERLRTQHACHLEELRARLAGERAGERAAERAGERAAERVLADKYKCLKEKYARLKHDVKMSIERRNKRREMSMTTGSETEKSNSHKNNQSLEKCKEVNETSVSAIIEPEPRIRLNNNPAVKYNDNETSYSDSNAHKSIDNNNDDWKKRDSTLQTSDVSQNSAAKPRKAAVAFKEPPRRRREKEKDTAATDYHDSSDATTADEKPKETVNGHGRRRCFTRLKSASTSRLNYSPKRNEGWSSPLESLRQQLRKLDDLEDQFPDLACQTAYSLRYPFSELSGVATADSAELEFVRHRALIEREGMRRARAVLKRRSAALKETRACRLAHNAPTEEREVTELEVALHRARALLGEKEIRLRHIERALRKLAGTQPPLIQETVTSEVSSEGEEAVEPEATGAVLRSLRALHADVRDIWRALDATRTHTASPETSSCNAPSTSQTRMTLSAPDPETQDLSDGGMADKTRSLRAWLQTSP